ncbi:MAG: TrkA family potassium uptake protein [Clostridiales bacterium]|nr:TrkA family potassium uptake protein [Clostridiales bacterium]
MFKNKSNVTTYAIIGLGRFGSSLVTELAQSNCEMIVLDSDEEKIREMREYTENAFIVHSLDKKTLSDAGVQNCDVAIVCIGEHLDTSILVTLTLVGMGIPKVIAKAKSPEHGEILEKLGAEVVYPERDMALRLASRLETSRMLDIVQLSEKINISKLSIPDHMVGKTVVDMNIRAKFNLNIIAVENNGTVIETAQPDYVFRKNDILYLSGSKEGMIKFIEWVRKN